MASYRSIAEGAEKCSCVPVIDLPFGHGSDHPEDMFEGDIAFGGHKGRKHAFGVLFSFLLRDVADDDADNDLYVLFCAWISYEPSDISMDVKMMYL